MGNKDSGEGQQQLESKKSPRRCMNLASWQQRKMTT
jgi:hypothetical protein